MCRELAFGHSFPLLQVAGHLSSFLNGRARNMALSTYLSTSVKREAFAVYSALNSYVHPVYCDKDALRE